MHGSEKVHFEIKGVEKEITQRSLASVRNVQSTRKSLWIPGRVGMEIVIEIRPLRSTR